MPPRWRSLETVTSDGPTLDMDLLAASLRADSSDVNAYVESLAARLESALPGRVRVYRWRDRMFGPKRVRKMAIDLGDQRLELKYEGGGLEASCARLSGGIVLKSEAVPTDAWLAMLGEALANEAERSETTRKALERLLID
jgi:hypothetical protein